MDLIDLLNHSMTATQSMFQRQLLKEDIRRLKKIMELADKLDNKTEFLKEGTYIGWTKDDMRTGEIKEPLEALLSKIFDAQKQNFPPDLESEIREAWIRFSRIRIEKLIHCL